MKILLIGHSVVDVISESGRKTTKPGGIYYSAAAFESIRDENDSIELITGIDEKNYHLFAGVYDKINLDRSEKINKAARVNLKVFDKKEREEIYDNIPSSISLNKIINFSEFDGILINMITGTDISLSDLKYIRNNYNGLIYFDVHTLSRGIDEQMKRNFRVIPEAEKWIENVDILQVNEYELKTLSAENNNQKIIEFVLNSGPEFLIITHGESGAEIFFKENNKVKFQSISGIKFNSINKIGCGDVFGSVFFYLYIQKKDFYYSLIMANKAGGLVTTYNNVNDYGKLKNDLFGGFD